MKRFFVALFVLASVAVSAQKSVLLRANYNKGDKYTMKLEQIQNMGLQGGVNMAMTFDMIVSESSKDSIVTSAKIKTVKMDVMQGGTNVSYDSTMDESKLDAMGKMMKSQVDPMLKTSIITTINNLNKTLRVRVDPANPTMNQFTDNASSVIFPEEKVSVGSTWEMQDENMGMKLNTVYTVDKIENGTVYVTISGTVSGMGEGEIKGKTEIDIKSGVLKMLDNSVKVSAMGAEVTVTSKVTMTKQ